jgi:hypothetical protein
MTGIENHHKRNAPTLKNIILYQDIKMVDQNNCLMCAEIIKY